MPAFSWRFYYTLAVNERRRTVSSQELSPYNALQRLCTNQLSLLPPPPLADHLVRYLFLVAGRRIAASPAPGAAFATTAAVPSVVVWARTVPGVAVDGLLDNLLLHLLIYKLGVRHLFLSDGGKSDAQQSQ